MPDFWEYPTVSMGLGPINAVYHARFNRYLQNRRLDDTSNTRVWCFVGDGECDEPETLGALSLASRERLDNLFFVVNCNLQRLDGPVRGNGKIIQELEAQFRGAGWNVIKVIWGSKWDALLARDVDGVLLNKMNTTVDGEFQRYTVESGAYIREHFFGPDPRLRRLVEHLSDDELRLPSPRRARLPQALRRVQGRRREPGLRRADGHPRQDDQGVDARPRRRGTQRDAPDQEDDGRAAADPARPPDAARPRSPRSRSTRATRPTTGRRSTRSSTSTWSSGAACSTARSPVAWCAARRPLELPADTTFNEVTAGSGNQAVSTTMAFTRLRAEPDPRRALRATRRADHPGRGPHVRHGRAVPRGEDLRIAGPALRARRRRPAALLHRGQGRPDPRGGHHRGGRPVELHRRGHELRAPRRADGAVLHLLFDVRLPARRRPDLARGRRPRPRLPARRHGRTHDAAR